MKSFIKPSDMMKSWSIENLIECKNVMELKFNDLEFKKFYSLFLEHSCDFVSIDGGYRSLNGAELDQLELQIKRVKNLIVVVSDEINSRN